MLRHELQPVEGPPFSAELAARARELLDQDGISAVSIDDYSPPLVRVGQYRRDHEGHLRRAPEHGRKELFDDTIGSGGLAESARG